ncbi:MAG: nitrous oxide reductase accessory protein NosL [Steroidobacteraceae bacterium]|nr:nitrous oxide reductase accessory protein NosL [Deltaproteobacteria bacterium]
MMRILMLMMFLLLTFSVAAAADPVEDPKACQQCGMNRIMFAHSRMLIGYADGTTVGVCSLHCAATDMKKSWDKQVVSLKVADYTTRELTDARSATWVVGGRKSGVMTELAKWAFAREEDAQKFVQENGGKVTTFDQALQAAKQEMAELMKMSDEQQAHMGHEMGHDMSVHMGPGSQMVFNPAFSDDIYHVHPAGMWMTSYKFMHQEMNGLQDGTKDVPAGLVSPQGSQPYGFMMTPTRMTMDMQMLMVMYGVTDDVTLMAMANYQSMTMEMLMNMGMGNVAVAPMRTSGFGDTELRGIYKINDYLVGSLGLSLPTGDTHQQIEMMNRSFRAPYDMQLGSGTFDLKPALTYSALSEDALWNWGGQAMYSYHPGNNDDGYSLGNNLKLTSWLQRAIGPASTWLRLTFNDTGRIHGRDTEIAKMLDSVTGASTPDADPANYGGQRLDGLIGVSYAKGPFSFGAEGGIPLFQDVNGLQLANNWYLTSGFQVMF